MCPSYQATRDEKDSTRGRANALRLAITGQLGFDGLHRPRASTRCSTSASSARRARASARPTSTWPGSRPSSCTSTITSMACRCGTASSATSPQLGRMGCGAGAALELADAEPARPMAQRGVAGDRPPPRAAGVCAADARQRLRRLPDSAHSDRSRGGVCSFPTLSPTTTSPSSAWRRSTLLAARRAASVTLGPARPALLRPAADLQRPARRGRRQRPPQRRAASRLGRARAGRSSPASRAAC